MTDSMTFKTLSFAGNNVNGSSRPIDSNSLNSTQDFHCFLGNSLNSVKKQSSSQEDNSLDIPNIPHIESILRAFGFSPKQVDNVFNEAKLENGKLDIAKIIIKLNQISSGIKQKESEQSLKAGQKSVLTIEGETASKVLKQLGKMDIHLPVEQTDKSISIQDLISGLEQKIKKPAAANQLPDNTKAAITQTAANVGSAGQNNASAMLPSFDPKMGAQDLKNKATEKNNILAFLQKPKTGNAKEQHTLKNDKLLSLLQASDTGKDLQPGFIKEDILAFLQKNHKINPDAQSWQNQAKVTLSLKQAGFSPVSEFVSTAASANVLDPVNTARPRTLPETGVLPKYLINQVGKKVAMSVLKKDSFIKLQLKPPELGNVKIKMDVTDNVLKLGMTLENDSVKELLLSNIHDLKRVMGEQGIKMDKLEVNINADFDQAMKDSNDANPQNQQGHKGKKTVLSDPEDNMQIMPSALSRQDALLDLME